MKIIDRLKKALKKDQEANKPTENLDGAASGSEASKNLAEANLKGADLSVWKDNPPTSEELDKMLREVGKQTSAVGGDLRNPVPNAEAVAKAFKGMSLSGAKELREEGRANDACNPPANPEDRTLSEEEVDYRFKLAVGPLIPSDATLKEGEAVTKRALADAAKAREEFLKSGVKLTTEVKSPEKTNAKDEILKAKMLDKMQGR